jgi:hypothetical protein
MEKVRELEARREQILIEIRNIRAMRKGSVTEQYLKVKTKGREEPVSRGPYFLYTRKEKGKSVGHRLSVEQADCYRQEVVAYHHFQALCNEYAETTERLGDLERAFEDGSQEKKLRKSRSRRTKK